MMGKILTLDRALTDDRALNSSYSAARTVLQHEVVVWDPEQLLDSYSTGSDYKNAACLTDHASVAFQHDLRRRTQEFKDFLSLGRLLVIFVPAPFHWYYANGDQRNEGTAAKPRMVRIVDDIGVEAVLPVALDLVRGEGEECRLVAGSPFSSFWRVVGEQFYFSAYFAKPVGETLLAMAGTDRPIAALVKAGGGNVLLLPQLGHFEPDDDEIGADADDDDFDEKYELARHTIQNHHHGQFIDALLILHSELVGGADDALAAWSEDYLLPGEADRVADLIVAQERLATVQQDVETAQAELVALQRQKRLVTGTGRALEACVEDALSTLGCVIEEGEPGRTDCVARWGSRTAVVEIKGLSKSAKEANAAQLEKWVIAYMEEHERRPKAILVVNAWREKPLDERTDPAFPDQMLKYAVGREHCLIEAQQILTAAVTCKTKKAKTAFLKSLFETVGTFVGYGWETALTKVESDEASPEVSPP